MDNLEYFYFGILEKQVAYKKEEEITLDFFKEQVLLEGLDKYAKIEFNPKNINQANMIALITEGNVYSVLQTGERASGYKINFDKLGLALNYMLASLRLKKNQVMKDDTQKKL